MKNKAAWPKVFAFVGIAIMGLSFAYYSTTVVNGGIGARVLGRGSDGSDLLTFGSAALLVGIAVFAVFGYLALKLGWSTVRQGR